MIQLLVLSRAWQTSLLNLLKIKACLADIKKKPKPWNVFKMVGM